jgi:hypothetical protein
MLLLPLLLLCDWTHKRGGRFIGPNAVVAAATV